MSNLIKRAESSPEYLRRKRVRAFEAFDIYKSNVYYGIVSETEECHRKIVSWYKSCLDLSLDAINNLPEEVKVYLKK